MATALPSRPIIRKSEDYEDRALLKLARLVPCRFTFPHHCQGLSMACHANWLDWHKAVGKKAPDWAWAAGCFAAHDAIDNKLNKTLTYEQREYEWMNAYMGTWNYIWANRLVRVA